MLDSDNLAVGMVRVRHYLNEKLRVHGVISVFTFGAINVAKVMPGKRCAWRLLN